MKFTVITPSIGRKTLVNTIQSILDNIGSQEVEHIVVADGIDARIRVYSLIEELRNQKYDFGNSTVKYWMHIFSTAQTKDSGNSQRHFANFLSTGEYTMYIDDDDIYINNTFDELAKQLENYKYPNFAVFPALRMGQRFFRDPPELCHTVSCQHTHKTVIETPDGNYRPLWQVEPPGHAYTADGVFVNMMRDKLGYTMLNTEKELVKVDLISVGKLDV